MILLPNLPTFRLFHGLIQIIFEEIFNANLKNKKNKYVRGKPFSKVI